MKRKQSREEWQRDLDAAQRNIVFPDTASNEARFWRNAMSGRRPLTWPQVFGFALIFLMMAYVFTSIGLDVLRTPSRLIGYLIPVVVVGIFLLLLRIAIRAKRRLY
jgi:hypothetical protein